LFEELFDKEERVEPTSHPKLRKAVLGSVWAEHELEAAVSAVLKAIRARNADTLKDTLRRFIPSYQPGSVTPREHPATNGAHAKPREVDAEVLPPLVVSQRPDREPRRPSPAP
jgi:hypothetical protein